MSLRYLWQLLVSSQGVWATCQAEPVSNPASVLGSVLSRQWSDQLLPVLSQDVLNLLPNLNVPELSRSFAVKSNDMMLVIYLASMIRSVLALHNLIDNKEQRVWRERQSHEKALPAPKDKAAEGKTGAEGGAAGENGKKEAARGVNGKAPAANGDAKKEEPGSKK